MAPRSRRETRRLGGMPALHGVCGTLIRVSTAGPCPVTGVCAAGGSRAADGSLIVRRGHRKIRVHGQPQQVNPVSRYEGVELILCSGTPGASVQALGAQCRTVRYTLESVARWKRRRPQPPRPATPRRAHTALRSALLAPGARVCGMPGAVTTYIAVRMSGLADAPSGRRAGTRVRSIVRGEAVRRVQWRPNSRKQPPAPSVVGRSDPASWMRRLSPPGHVCLRSAGCAQRSRTRCEPGGSPPVSAVSRRLPD